MNHNPLELKVRNTVMVDNDKPNRSKVEIVHITTHGMFATVRSLDTGNEWCVMTYRLSRIKEKEDGLQEN